MSKFKVGDKVRCVNAKQSGYLEHGRIYTVLSLDGLKPIVECGGMSWMESRFELVEQENEMNIEENIARMEKELADMKRKLEESKKPVYNPNSVVTIEISAHALAAITAIVGSIRPSDLEGIIKNDYYLGHYNVDFTNQHELNVLYDVLGKHFRGEMSKQGIPFRR